MKCPKCGANMEAGFLQSSSMDADIAWVSKILPLGLGYWKTDTQIVSEETALGANAIPTYICRHCKLLLGDYSQKA